MEKLLDAFLGALAGNPLVALVLLLIIAIVALGATIKRLFTLYDAAQEKRIAESNASRQAISEAIHNLDRVVEVLRMPRT